MTMTDADLRFEKACEWLLRLREAATSPELVMEWLDWCHEDPSNGRAFEQAREIWMAAGEITPVVAVAERVLLRTTAPAVPAHPKDGSARASGVWRRRLRTLWAPAAVAAVAIIAFLASPAWWLHFTPPSAEVYATEAGQRRMVRLPDGSKVVLAGGSRLLTAIDGRSRSMLLDRGQAYFEVAHDRLRPFVVTAGGLNVTAVGTAFDVRTSSGRVVISVAEGVVNIDDNVKSDPSTAPAAQVRERITLRARAGRMIALDSSGQPQVTVIDPAIAASWQQGRLVFVREPLSAVVDSIVRHTGRRLVLADSAAGEFRYTGTVFPSELEEWLCGLPTVFRVTVAEQDGNVVIASRFPES